MRRERGGVAGAIWAGFWTTAPVLLFIIPFGAYSGVVALEAGFGFWRMMALSVFVFAGASQIASLELMAAGAPWFVIVISGVAVNLRFIMYSASVAPHMRDASLGARLLAAYFTVDNNVSAFWRGVA